MPKPVTKPRSTCPDGSPHHWILDSVPVKKDDRSVLPGVCKKCGGEEDHPVAGTDDWNGRMTPRQESLSRGETWTGYQDRRLAEERVA